MVARLSVGGVFAAAGGIKLTEPIEDFIAIGHQWEILPDPFLTWYITALPWAEFIFGIMLIVGAFTRISAGMIALMTLSFVIGIVVNMARGKTLDDCGCFGGSFHFGDTFPQLLWRDLVIMALSVSMMFTRKVHWSVDSWLKKQ